MMGTVCVGNIADHEHVSGDHDFQHDLAKGFGRQIYDMVCNVIVQRDMQEHTKQGALVLQDDSASNMPNVSFVDVLLQDDDVQKIFVRASISKVDITTVLHEARVIAKENENEDADMVIYDLTCELYPWHTRIAKYVKPVFAVLTVLGFLGGMSLLKIFNTMHNDSVRDNGCKACDCNEVLDIAIGYCKQTILTVYTSIDTTRSQNNTLGYQNEEYYCKEVETLLDLYRKKVVQYGKKGQLQTYRDQLDGAGKAIHNVIDYEDEIVITSDNHAVVMEAIKNIENIFSNVSVT